MALMLLPTRFAGNFFRMQGSSLAVSAGRQLGLSVSNNAEFQSALSPLPRTSQRKSTILDLLQRSSPGLGSSHIHNRSFSSYPRAITSRCKALDYNRQSQLLPSLSPLQSSFRGIATIASPSEKEGQAPAPTRRIVAYHLFLCAAMVYLTIVVGGLTRLTESGLSITEWNPGFKGMKLPWTDTEWEEEWQKYKGTPEWAL